MSSPAPTPSSPASSGPARSAWPAETPPDPSTRRDWVVAALGTGLLAAAVVVSTVNARPTGDLDLSSYAIGLVATIALLATAAVLVLGGGGRPVDGRAGLAVYPGAIGALGAGLMVVVGLDASDLSIYLAGVVVLVLAAGIYLRAPGGALGVAGLLGAGLLYGQVVDDVLGLGDTDGGFVTAALVVLGFVLAVTGLGWLLPRTRAVTGVVVGAFSVVSYGTLMGAIIVSSAFAGLLAPLTGSLDGSADGGFPAVPEVDTYTDDVYVILLVDVVLLAVWALAAYRTGHPGFRVLIVALSATQVPLATAALALDEPAWWGWAAVLVGAVVLAVVVRSSRGAVPPAGPGPAYPPPSGAPSGTPYGPA